MPDYIGHRPDEEEEIRERLAARKSVTKKSGTAASSGKRPPSKSTAPKGTSSKSSAQSSTSSKNTASKSTSSKSGAQRSGTAKNSGQPAERTPRRQSWPGLEDEPRAQSSSVKKDAPQKTTSTRPPAKKSAGGEQKQTTSGASGSRSTQQPKDTPSKSGTDTAPRSSTASKSGTTGSSSQKSTSSKPGAGKNTSQKSTPAKSSSGKSSAQKSAPVKSTSGKAGTQKSTSAKSSGSKDTSQKSAKQSAEQKKQTAATETAPRPPRKAAKSQSRSKLNNILSYAFMILAFAAIMVILCTTVFFKVERVTIAGLSDDIGYTTDELLLASGIDIGDSMFSVSEDRTEEQIEYALPYIAECEVERKFPSAVHITVTKAEAIGIVTLDDGTRLVISKEGKALERLADLSGSDIVSVIVSESDLSGSDITITKDGLPLHSEIVSESDLAVITGIELNSVEPGMFIVSDDEVTLSILEQLMLLLDEYNLPPDKIDLTTGNISVLYDNRITIRIGVGTQLDEKIEMAAEIIHNRLTKYDVGYVTVSNVEEGYYTPAYVYEKI